MCEQRGIIRHRYRAPLRTKDILQLGCVYYCMNALVVATLLQLNFLLLFASNFPSAGINYFCQCNCDAALPALNFGNYCLNNGALISANDHKLINKIAITLYLYRRIALMERTPFFKAASRCLSPVTKGASIPLTPYFCLLVHKST